MIEWNLATEFKHSVLSGSKDSLIRLRSSTFESTMLSEQSSFLTRSTLVIRHPLKILTMDRPNCPDPPNIKAFICINLFMLAQGLQINKTTAGSGGFKMPYESIEKRQKRNKQQLPDDLPSKSELFNQLGLIPDDLSLKQNAHQGNQIAVSRRMILEKDLPPKPPVQAVQPVKKTVSQKRLTSEELEKMLEEHRKQMQPIAEEYQDQRLKNMRGTPKKKSKTPKKPKSVHVNVTYHKEQLRQDVEKLKKSQRDLSGPHGDFLKQVMPQTQLKKFNSEKQLVQDADFQQKFKNYLRNKRTQDQHPSDSQIEFDLYQSTSPNRERWNAKHKHKAVFKDSIEDSNLTDSRKSSKKRVPKKSQSPMDQVQLAEHIFRQIDEAQKNQNSVDKLATIKYLVNNQEILEAFAIHAKELNTLINKFPTKVEGSFNLKEFTRFLTKFHPQNQHEAFGGLSHVSQQQQQSSCLLNQNQINTLKDVFEKMQTDLVANRLDFVKALRNDIHVVRILHVQAAYIAQIDRILTLDAILSQIETQAKDHPYISWKQFMDQFEYDVPVSKQQLSYVSVRDSQQQVDDQDKVDAPKDLIDFINQQFATLQMDDYAQTEEIIESIRRSPLYPNLKKEVVRKQSKKSDIPSETLEQLLNRILEDAHEYLTLPEFLQYFSRRGLPKFEEEIASLARSVNVTDALQNQQNLIDGYDSDPELHLYQDKKLPRERMIKKNPSSQALLTYSHRKQRSKSGQSEKRVTREDFLNAILPKPQYGAQSKPSDYHFRVTQPDPFNFDQREKERSLSIRKRKLQEMLEEKKRSQEFKPFRAKEIPETTKQPLFEKIMTDNQRRREEVKKNSVQLTLRNEKPFSFYRRDKEKPHKKARRKYWEEREKFVFKAKAIPWHVHVELLRQMEQDENTKRKERIAKHAHELAMNSRMPPRMEMHERQKSASAKSPKYMKTQVSYKAKPIPDFEKLHSSFQDQLNRKKQQMRTTEAEPFNFQTSKKGLEREYMDQENLMRQTLPKEDPVMLARQKMSQKPVQQPPATKKWEDYCESVRKQKHKKASEERKKKEEEEERLRRKEKFKDRVQKSEAIQDNSKKLLEERKEKIKKLKEEQKKIEKEQMSVINNCKLKAQNHPLLMERPTKRDVKMEKMKQVAKMDKILKTTGVMKREEYFNEEEKKMLQDIDYLKKHGYEDDFE